MDGQVLAVAARDAAVVSLSALLQSYYLDPPVAGRPHVTARFADFVRMPFRPFHTATPAAW